jgi:glycerol-3-phosphate cytidylyltransferase
MKIIKFNDLNELSSELKKNNKTIVLTNGCFDILHIGHLRYLKKAKELGDILIVGLNSDNSVKKLKGSLRPINNENDRAEILSYIEFIDYITIFNDETAENLIDNIKPNIYVKGGDYNINNLPENKILLKNKIKVIFIPFINGYSTTNIINKLYKK